MALFSVIHKTLTVAFLFYPYIVAALQVKAPLFDYFYLVVKFCVLLSWPLFNGECVINLIKKQRQNSTYKAGDDIAGGDGYAVIQKVFRFCIRSVYLCMGKRVEKQTHLENIFIYNYDEFFSPAITFGGFLILFSRLGFLVRDQIFIGTTFIMYYALRKKSLPVVHMTFFFALSVCLWMIVANFLKGI